MRRPGSRNVMSGRKGSGMFGSRSREASVSSSKASSRLPRLSSGANANFDQVVSDSEVARAYYIIDQYHRRMTLDNPFATSMNGHLGKAHGDSGSAEGEEENNVPPHSTEKQSVAREAAPAGRPITSKAESRIIESHRTENRKSSLFEIEDADDVFDLKRSRRSVESSQATTKGIEDTDTDREKSASEPPGAGGSIGACGSTEEREVEGSSGGEGEAAGGGNGET